MWLSSEMDGVSDAVEELKSYLLENEEVRLDERDAEKIKGLFREIESELKGLDSDIDEKNGEINGLEDEVEKLEEKLEAAEGLVAQRLNVFADPANWNGRTWDPVMVMYADPVEFAERGVVI